MWHLIYTKNVMFDVKELLVHICVLLEFARATNLNGPMAGRHLRITPYHVCYI
jgi:hypothetical protein